jgi:radical SAM superfamily enzyme YgiQ (UPF0313 family)
MHPAAPIPDRWPALSAMLGQLRSGYTFLPRKNDTFPSAVDPDGPRILILRLSSHADVEESLTHLVLYDLVSRALPTALVDLAFFPCRQDQEALARAGLPWPLSVRSLGELRDFDIILVNVSYVLELANLLPVLDSAGLSPWSSERGSDDPLIIAGGSAALAAQAMVRRRGDGQPQTWDALADALFFGEAEDAMPEMLYALTAPPAPGTDSRTDHLRKLASIEGAWVPTLSGPGTPAAVRKATCRRQIDAAGAAEALPVLNGRDAATCRMQISYGCPFSCSFCFEGFERKPYRDIPGATLVKRARRLRAATGARSLDLISFNFNTHRELGTLMPELNRIFRHVHFMSQRLDILNQTEHLLENEFAADKRSYTLGVEGISARFRRYFDKRLNDEDIMQVVTRLLQAKAKEIKFFFILSGQENGQDLDEFSRFLTAIAARRRLAAGTSRMVFSFGVLCRMPHTPLQHAPGISDRHAIRHLIDGCRLTVESQDFEFRTAFSPLEHELAQLLCLGDTGLPDLLESLHQAGVQFDGCLPESARPVIEHHAPARHANFAALSEERDTSWQPFFSFVDCGYVPGELHRRYLECRAALDDAMLPAPAVPRPRRPGQDIRRPLAELLADKNRAPVLMATIIVDPGCAGASREWLEAWCLRGISARLGDADGIIDVKLSGHSTDEAFWPKAWHGLAEFQIAWEPESRLPERLAAVIAEPAAQGLALKSVSELGTGTSQLTLSVDLPLPLDQATAGWNRLIQSIGLGATMTKPGAGVLFAISPRDKGKKSLHRLELCPVDAGYTRCQLVAGTRFDTDRAMAHLLSNRRSMFLPLEISGIIHRA